ncbi:outer membrane chaperone Skp (OmpH) [Pirellula staleyi DSM 6068]|uniref:Outer membrane chaperone Skp (OmpH) n=1 Tax=Pirellula staleyi (strain ATCC 27377 / DSM 6068 / ICPB 4128) TaxID=530564 RepID=D2QWQ2_PIRSD|nr:OmpH family outer membrane protein [Pirellula staleyi]ADB17855.1 outer membrane chaperone Skp (OmpH) [Pirellula staleyi DSM 6068]
MRVNFFTATVVAGLVAILGLTQQANAQGVAPGAPAARPAAAPAAAASGTNVAVIDVAHIFKNHTRFNGMMMDIKKDIEDFEAIVRNEQKKFNAMREELVQFKPSSIEYKQKEEELARVQADLQVKVGIKRKEFLEQEAAVYYRVYREVEQAVGVFAQRNRIGLVLRYNGDDIKQEDRASVLQGVNRAVVYQMNLDITEFVLQMLNANAPAAPAPGPSPGPQGSISRPNPVGPQVPRTR